MRACISCGLYIIYSIFKDHFYAGFCRSVNLIPTKGGRFCLSFTFGSPKIFHLLASVLCIVISNTNVQSKYTRVLLYSQYKRTLVYLVQSWKLLSFSSHFCDLVFGCFWQPSYQNIM